MTTLDELRKNKQTVRKHLQAASSNMLANPNDKYVRLFYENVLRTYWLYDGMISTQEKNLKILKKSC